MKAELNGKLILTGVCNFSSAIAAGPLLYSLGIAGPFADYINTNFLCQIAAQRRYVLDAPGYLKRAKLATRLGYIAEANENCYFTEVEKVRFVLGVFRGHCDQTLAQCLAPNQFPNVAPALELTLDDALASTNFGMQAMRDSISAAISTKKLNLAVAQWIFA